MIVWLARQDWQAVRWMDCRLGCLDDILSWEANLLHLEQTKMSGDQMAIADRCSPFALIHARLGDEALLRLLRRLDIQPLSKELLFLALRARQPDLLRWLYSRGYASVWGVEGEVLAAVWLCETGREAMLSAFVDTVRRMGRRVNDWTRVLMATTGDLELLALIALYFDAA